MRALFEQLDIDIQQINLGHAEIAKSLISLIELAEGHSLGYAVGKDVSGRLSRLHDWAVTKNHQIVNKNLGHRASHDMLDKSPAEQWQLEYEEASKSWWQNLFIKRRINKSL